MSDRSGSQDSRHIGLYTVLEAARYLRVPFSTVRAGVAVLQLPASEMRLLSFINLVELHILNAVRHDHKISLETVRQKLTSIQKSFGNEHPLACQRLYTQSRNLLSPFLGLGVTTLNTRQVVIPEMIQVYLDRIDWDDLGLPERLYPLTRPQNAEAPKWIEISPRVSFGEPVVVGTGICTAMLAQRYAAGESIDELAAHCGCERLMVEEAIRYELPLYE